MSWYGLTQKPTRFPLIQIVTTSIPPATQGVAYSTHLTVINGIGPLTFTVSGSTNNWASINSSGFLFGTPQVADVETLTVTVTDGTGMSPTSPSNFTLTVQPQSTIDFSGLFLGNSLQGISLVTEPGAGGGNAFIQFTGTDTKYLNTLPRTPNSTWGGTGADDRVQEIYLNAKADGTSADLIESIATDNTVPTGVSPQVRVTTAITPQTQSSVIQNAYQLLTNTSTPQGMLYTSHWAFFPADITSRTGGVNQLMELVEFKTPGGPGEERFQINWAMTSWALGLNTPAFVCIHDQDGGTIYFEQVMSNTNTNFGIGQTYMAPLLPGTWFRLEWAFNRIDAQGQGWMWAALTIPSHADANLRNGIQFFAQRGPVNANGQTLGFNAALPAQNINRIFIDNATYGSYTRSAANPAVFKATDYQVYTRWPSTATAHPSNFL